MPLFDFLVDYVAELRFDPIVRKRENTCEHSPEDEGESVESVEMLKMSDNTCMRLLGDGVFIASRRKIKWHELLMPPEHSTP